MSPIRYQPGASYEEQLRIWANGNEDEHRLAVFLEARVAFYVEQATERVSSDAYDDGYSEGHSDGYSDGYDAGRANAS